MLSVSAVFGQENDGLVDLQENRVELKSYGARLIVVNFWALWCKPCVQEFPELNQLYLRLKARGVVVLGVSLSPSKDAVEKFLEKHKVDFPIVIDRQEHFADKYRVSVLPTTVLIDSDNNILYRYQGFSKTEMLKMENIMEDYLQKNKQE